MWRDAIIFFKKISKSLGLVSGWSSIIWRTSSWGEQSCSLVNVSEHGNLGNTAHTYAKALDTIG